MKRASRSISVMVMPALLVVCALGAKAAEVTLIKSGTILTVTKGTTENGDILIRDGKIAEVGKGLTAPEGAKVIDATGLFVMPGIIDCHSHIAVAGSVNEGSVSVSSMVNIADVLEPRGHRHLPRLGGWRHHRQHSARQRQCHRGTNHRDQAALGKAG